MKPPDTISPRVVTALALGAAAIRVVAALRSEVIRRDGIYFLEQARHFANGDWSTALGWYQHPMFAGLTALLARLTGLDAETAGRTVAIACGSLAVIPLALLTARLFGRRAGLAVAVIYAALPHAVRGHVHPLSEGPFHAFLLTAAWAAVRAADARAGGRLRWALGAGLASGAAYLARPEGLGVALVTGAVLAIGRAEPLANRARAIAALVLGVSLTAGPYVAYLSIDAGTLRMTAKKDIGVLAGVKGDRPIQRLSDEGLADRPARTAWQLVKHTAESLSYVAFALALLGLGVALRRGRPRLGTILLGAAILLHLAVLFRLAYTYSYLDKRHTLTPGLLLLPWAGLAVAAVSSAITRERRTALYALLAVLAAASLPSAWKAVDHKRIPLKRLGRWTAAHLDAPVIAPLGFPWVSYYAGARPLDVLSLHQDVWFANPAPAAFNALGASLRRTGVGFVVSSSRQPDALRAWLTSRTTEVHRVRGKGEDWWAICRWPRAESPGGSAR